MFDLEQAVSDWRSRMRESGVTSGDTLNELESHLRDTFDDLRRRGEDPSRAWESATARLGPNPILEAELRKSGTHADPDWGLRLCLAAIAVSSYLAYGKNGAYWPFFFGIPVSLLVVLFVCAQAFVERRRGIARRRWPLRLGCIALLVAGVVSWMWYASAGPGYYRELRRVEAALAAIPGATPIEVRGHHDLTYEDIGAWVRVGDRGHIRLLGLTESSFSSARELVISEIDRYRFRWHRWGYGAVIGRDGRPVRYQTNGGSLRLRGRDAYSPGNQWIGRMPCSIRTVQDLVRNYDVVCAWLEERHGKKFELVRPDEEMIFLIDRRG